MKTSEARRGIARTMPLLVLTGFAAATFAVLASSRPLREPAPAAVRSATNVKMDDDCAEVRAFPHTGIQDANGSLWDLDEIPGHAVRGLDVRGGQWQGVDLHGATFVGCDFRHCDLTGADLDGVTFERCHLEAARLDSVDFRTVEFSECYVRGAKMDGEDLAPWASNCACVPWFELLRTSDEMYPPK